MKIKPNRFKQNFLYVTYALAERTHIRAIDEKHRVVCLSCEKEKCSGECEKVRRKKNKETDNA